MADRQVGVAIVVTDKGAAVIDANGQKVKEYVRTTVEGNRQLAASADEATAAEGRMAASKKHLEDLRTRTAKAEQAELAATKQRVDAYKDLAAGALNLGASTTALANAYKEATTEGGSMTAAVASLALGAQQGFEGVGKLTESVKKLSAQAGGIAALKGQMDAFFASTVAGAASSVVALGALAVKLHELQATYIENVRVQQDAEEAEARTHDMTRRQIQQYSELAKALGMTTGQLRQIAPDWRAVVELSKQDTEQGRQLAAGLQKLTGERTKERDATAAAAAQQKNLKDLRVEANVVDATAAVNAKAVAEARGQEATETRKLSASVAELQEQERKFYEERRKAPPGPQQSFQPGSGGEAPTPPPSAGGKFGEQTAAEVAAALGFGASFSVGIGSGKQTGFGMSDPRTAALLGRLESMVSREGPHSAIKGAVTEFKSALQAGDLMGAQKIVDAIQNQSNVAARMGLGGADRFGAAAFGMRQALGEANQVPDDLLKLARRNMDFVPRELRGAANQALQDVERGGFAAIPEQMRGAVEAALGGKMDQAIAALQSLVGLVGRPSSFNVDGAAVGSVVAPHVARELERNNLLTQRR